MKKYLITGLIALAVSVVISYGTNKAYAPVSEFTFGGTPVSWQGDLSSKILEPLHTFRDSTIKANNFQATSTTAINTLPVLANTTGTTTGKYHFGSFFDMAEIATPVSPSTDVLRLWAEDNFGKTRFYAQDSGGNAFALFRDNVFVCRNSTIATITKGSVVYINGQVGNSRPTCALADADTEATMPAVGLAYEEIAVDGDGWVVSTGVISGLATSQAGSAGDIVYASSTAGAFGMRPDMPALTQQLGVILTSHGSNGKIAVNVPPTVRFGAPTSGSILFANGDSLLAQNNANLNWNDTLLRLNATNFNTGNSTSTQATTTTLYVSGNASTTTLYGSGLFPCHTGNFLTWDNGLFGCGADQTGEGGGITSLNSQTGSTQTFASSTSGSDFSITSTGNVHTWTLPTASGSVRGLLSSTDWTTFNSKVSGSRALTINGTANQITSSAGAQDLSADRTWTLSLPNHVIFPGSINTGDATSTNATSTTSFATNASSTNLFSSNLNVSGFAFTVTGAPTLNNWFDQSVKTTASPTFSALTVTTINGLTISSSAGTLTIPTSASLIRAGGHSLTLTTSGTTDATFPSGTITLVDLGTAQTITALKTFSGGLLSTASSTILDLTMTVSTTTGRLIIPVNSNPSKASVGALALDSTSNNLIIATSTTGHVVIGSATTTLYAFSVASTSPVLRSAGTKKLPPHFLPQVVTAVICQVEGGTSIVINLSNEAGSSDTNTITCTTTSTQFALTSNNSYTAYSVPLLEVGTITGTVDHLTMRFVGYRTSD